MPTFWLAPSCPRQIYPVKLTQEAIYVDVTAGRFGGVRNAYGRGGAGTSAENNNVFTVQPTGGSAFHALAGTSRSGCGGTGMRFFHLLYPAAIHLISGGCKLNYSPFSQPVGAVRSGGSGAG